MIDQLQGKAAADCSLTADVKPDCLHQQPTWKASKKTCPVRYPLAVPVVNVDASCRMLQMQGQRCRGAWVLAQQCSALLLLTGPTSGHHPTTLLNSAAEGYPSLRC